jgi:methylmalonyl-CoA mutase cobalamin-binding subunit
MPDITVTVADDHLPAIDGVVEALRARGMEVDQVLTGLGMVTGSAPAAAQAQLAQIAGVASVDAQLRTQLAPPDSPVQ